ncbi:MAG: nucleotidyltransferase family protein [Leptolyngbyaceae cyanobacterium]
MTSSTWPLSLTPEQVAAFCDRWQIVEMALFGSILREDFRPESDIDILISFSPDAVRGLLKLARIKHELEDLLERPVDLVVKQSVLDSDNWIRRQNILDSAQIVYAA